MMTGHGKKNMQTAIKKEEKKTDKEIIDILVNHYYSIPEQERRDVLYSPCKRFYIKRMEFDLEGE